MTPLYATEEQVAELVLGRGRLREWRAIAVVLERHGLPPIEPAIGLRFWPAVEAFLKRRYGLGGNLPSKPDGAEQWPTKSTRPASDGESATADNIVPIGLPDRT